MTSYWKAILCALATFAAGCGDIDDPAFDTTIAGGKAEDVAVQQFASFVGTYRVNSLLNRDASEENECPHTVTLSIENGVLSLTTIEGYGEYEFSRTLTMGTTQLCVSKETYEPRYAPAPANCLDDEMNGGQLMLSAEGPDTLLQHITDSNNGQIGAEYKTTFKFEGNTVTSTQEVFRAYQPACSATVFDRVVE